MVVAEREEYADKNLKIRHILGLVFSILLVYFGIDTIYNMVTTFYEHGGSEWRSWHPNTWVFIRDIEFPLIPALALSMVCLVAGLFIASNLSLRWFRHQRVKPIQPIYETSTEAESIKLMKTIQKLQLEKENLTRALKRYESEPSGKAGLILLFLGAIALVSSTIFTSPVLAFIGLGLSFWGTFLFLFIRPARYVKRDLLDSTIAPSLITIDRILRDLNYQGNGIYLPPRWLKGLKEGVVFIPAKKEIVAPAIGEALQGKVFINPHGMCLVPLGQGLVNLFEKELGTDLFKTDLDYLQNNLPKLLTEDLKLVKDFEMSVNGNMVHVRMTGSIYSNLCSEVRKLTNICSRMACSLCSAIAYALAKVTGKAVTIEKNEFHPDDTVETWYRLIEG